MKQQSSLNFTNGRQAAITSEELKNRTNYLLEL